MTQDGNRAELGKDDVWLELVFPERTEFIEVCDATDMLYEVDRLHRDDALQCERCGMPIGFEALVEDTQPVTCGCCPEGGRFVLSSNLLRTLAERIKQRFKLTRVSLNTASEFRRIVIEKFDEAKKKRDGRHESATGSELTPEIGVG